MKNSKSQNTEKTRICPMCGGQAEKLIGKWYRYDNGQQFLEFVCKQCVMIHNQLLETTS